MGLAFTESDDLEAVLSKQQSFVTQNVLVRELVAPILKVAHKTLAPELEKLRNLSKRQNFQNKTFPRVTDECD